MPILLKNKSPKAAKKALLDKIDNLETLLFGYAELVCASYSSPKTLIELKNSYTALIGTISENNSIYDLISQEIENRVDTRIQDKERLNKGKKFEIQRRISTINDQLEKMINSKEKLAKDEFYKKASQIFKDLEIYYIEKISGVSNSNIHLSFYSKNEVEIAKKYILSEKDLARTSLIQAVAENLLSPESHVAIKGPEAICMSNILLSLLYFHR